MLIVPICMLSNGSFETMYVVSIPTVHSSVCDSMVTVCDVCKRMLNGYENRRCGYEVNSIMIIVGDTKVSHIYILNSKFLFYGLIGLPVL